MQRETIVTALACPACGAERRRQGPADQVVHFACGRLIGRCWTYCLRCESYRHHGCYALKGGGEPWFCEECGTNTKWRKA